MNAVLGPVIEYGFAGAFAVTLGALLLHVKSSLKCCRESSDRMIEIVRENTMANERLGAALLRQEKLLEVLIHKEGKIADELYRRPCLDRHR